MEAAAELARGDDDKEKALGRQVEQLDYEARRAFEQYNEVDPRNRLVATELERRWNEKLNELERARSEFAALISRRPVVTDQQREELLSLGERFDAVWNDVACPVELKKKIVRTIVEEVVVKEEVAVKEESKTRLTFIVHWKGGTHTSFELARLSKRAAQRTTDEDLEIIRKMAVRYGDDAIARVLNKLGRRTGKGMSWSQLGVKTARRNHGIAGHVRTVEDPEVFTFNGAARHLGVSSTTIKRMVATGVLSMTQLAPFAPWEIQRSALDADPVSKVVAHLKKTGRLELPGEALRSQQKLFE